MRLVPVLLALLALVVSACGRSDDGGGGADRPAPGVVERDAGYAGFATKNTTRIAGGDIAETAAAVAQAVYPGGDGDRPRAVAVVDKGDWHSAVAASVLAAPPIGAPILFSDGSGLPDATRKAVVTTDPRGSGAVGGAQLIRVAGAPGIDGLKSVEIAGKDEFEKAQAIDSLVERSGEPSDAVIVTGAADPRYAMPAASLAAKTGAPVLFTEKDAVPAPTREAIAAHGRPLIVVIGPHKTVSEKAIGALKRLGSVAVATDADDPVRASIDVARFSDGGFGWGIVDPGHGLVFTRSNSPLSAAAAAPLSASGTYGPLLLLDSGDELTSSMRTYLRRIQPGHTGDPSRGVYNHGWIIGDEKAISASVQSTIDALLEIERAR